MTSAIVVTGADTDVGKTVFAAALVAALGAAYWKPIQAGLASPTDSESVARLSAAAPPRILREAYRLVLPASPHFAAEQESIVIDPERLRLPAVEGTLVVEGAGGALVPITRTLLFADLMAEWQAPVVIVARTALGTINHSLLTIEALRARNVPLLGIAFVGDANADSERTICEIGRVKRLGRLPRLERLETDALAAAFAADFRTGDFAG
ncbi:MAG: dethiobiotin synthase [Sphingomonadales bacterium]